jgi:hypothetical protein
VITDPTERRRVFTEFVEEFNHRHGVDSPWPKAVLDEGVERSPLAGVRFGEAGFISHAAGRVEGCYEVTELWASEEAHAAWFNHPRGTEDARGRTPTRHHLRLARAARRSRICPGHVRAGTRRVVVGAGGGGLLDRSGQAMLRPPSTGSVAPVT